MPCIWAFVCVVSKFSLSSLHTYVNKYRPFTLYYPYPISKVSKVKQKVCFTTVGLQSALISFHLIEGFDIIQMLTETYKIESTVFLIFLHTTLFQCHRKDKNNF